eukprot:scaffold11913_cov140-Isochrysis_galbana.AAC.3
MTRETEEAEKALSAACEPGAPVGGHGLGSAVKAVLHSCFTRFGCESSASFGSAVKAVRHSCVTRLGCESSASLGTRRSGWTALGIGRRSGRVCIGARNG